MFGRELHELIKRQFTRASLCRKFLSKNRFSLREQFIEIVNKLFIYTDNRQWDKIIEEVFTDSVLFDMSSAGGAEAASLAQKKFVIIGIKVYEELMQYITRQEIIW